MAKEEKMEEQVNNTPTSEKKIIKLNALQALDITLVPGGTREYKARSAESRYSGLSYLTYLYEGRAFVVPSEDAFVTLHTEGTIGEVTLQEENDMLSFLSAKSQKAMFNAHKFAITQKAFTVEFVQSKLTMEELNEAW